MKSVTVHSEFLERLGWFLENEDQGEDIQLTLSWEDESRVKVHRPDVDGGDFLNYDVYAKEFFRSDLPAIVRAGYKVEEG